MQPFPELKADVNGTGGAMVCGRDPVGVDGDEIHGGARWGEVSAGGCDEEARLSRTWWTIFATSGSGSENRLVCPTRASSTLRASVSHSLAGRGERSPKEQTTFCAVLWG